MKTITCLVFDKGRVGDKEDLLTALRFIDKKIKDAKFEERYPWLKKDLAVLYVEAPEILNTESYFKVFGDNGSAVLGGPLIVVRSDVGSDEYDDLKDEDYKFIRKNILPVEENDLPEELKIL